MVSFTCNACGQSVRKHQVEKHYQTVCRNCSVLSCIDCGKDFPGDTYAAHTSCISEAEKYQGNLYQAKENKGEEKQREWMKRIAVASIADPRLSSLLSVIAGYSNVPRKQKKFENFCKNSLRVYDKKTLDCLWQAFSGPPEASRETEEEKQSLVKVENEAAEVGEGVECSDGVVSSKVDKPKAKKRKNKDISLEEPSLSRLHNGQTNCDNNLSELNTKKKHRKDNENKNTKDNGNTMNSNDDESVPNGMDIEMAVVQGKFRWHRGIKHALQQAEQQQLGMKKLRKKVLAAYQQHGLDHRASTRNEMRATFDKKLKTYPKVKITKEIVYLVS